MTFAPNADIPHPFDRARFDAILFDLDGVLTETATTHKDAWKAMFDDYLREHAQEDGEPFSEFTADDYLRYVDGKPRFDGVRAFLASREIAIPEGTSDDPPGTETICGLGNRKNEQFNLTIARTGVEPLPHAVNFVTGARDAGMRTAVVSSSANAGRVMAAAAIDIFFEDRVDGVVARQLGLPGNPQPDTFLEAARRLGTNPERAVVIEDAISGVAAGRAGGFGLVIGIGGAESAPDLLANGADIVVEDLGAFIVD